MKLGHIFPTRPFSLEVQWLIWSLDPEGGHQMIAHDGNFCVPENAV
jgi:hypothetical protein